MDFTRFSLLYINKVESRITISFTRLHLRLQNPLEAYKLTLYRTGKVDMMSIILIIKVTLLETGEYMHV